MTNSRKLDENINTINTIKTIKTIDTIKTNKTMVVFVDDKSSPTITSDISSARPLGPCGSLDGVSPQEGKGVVEIAPPKLTLQQEKKLLIDAEQWIHQNSVDFVKVSIFPQLDSQNLYNDYKCQYGLKLHQQDLRKHQYSCKVTSRHNDYLGYAKTKWDDAETWKYPEVADIIKTSWKIGCPAYGGRASVNAGVRKANRRMPILAYTTILINYEHEEEQWCCHVWHHDFYKMMTIPNWEWEQAKTQWIQTYGIKKEFHKKVPPMIAFEWRNLL